MERKNNPENSNLFLMTPNINANHVSYTQNEKLKKLFCYNDYNHSKLASKNLSQIKNSYSSNQHKNKIILPNKINELGDFNLNDSLSESKLNKNIKNKNFYSNLNNNINITEIKSYNYKDKENAAIKYFSNKIVENNSFNKKQIKGNKINDQTNESSININNNSLINNIFFPNVKFQFSSNSKDRNTNYSNSNTLQNISSIKIKSNELSRINNTDKENKPSIDFNKIKDKQNKGTDNNPLKSCISKYNNNLKLNNNSYFIKTEYLNMREKVKNKIASHENNKNINIIENLNSIKEVKTNKPSYLSKNKINEKDKNKSQNNITDKYQKFYFNTESNCSIKENNYNKTEQDPISNKDKNEIAFQILKIEKSKEKNNHLTRNLIKENIAYNSQIYHTSVNKSNKESPNRNANEGNYANKINFLKINNIKRNTNSKSNSNKIKSSEEKKEVNNFKHSVSNDSHLDLEQKLKKGVPEIKIDVKNRINIKNVLKNSNNSSKNANNDKIGNLMKNSKMKPNVLSEISGSMKKQQNCYFPINDNINKTNIDYLQSKNPALKFSSSNNIIGNNINNFINTNNSFKDIIKNNPNKNNSNILNNNCFSNSTLFNENTKDAFSLEKKNSKSYQKINPQNNNLNYLKNSLGYHMKNKIKDNSNEEKSLNIKDRSNVLSDQVKKISSKINPNMSNNYSLLNKNNINDIKKPIDNRKMKKFPVDNNFKFLQLESNKRPNILNNDVKVNNKIIPNNYSISNNYNQNKKQILEKQKYEVLSFSKENKNKNNSLIIPNFNDVNKTNNNLIEYNLSGQLNELSIYPSIQDCKFKDNSDFNNKITEISFIDKNELSNQYHIGKLGLKKINSIIKNSKANNLSYDYNKEKELIDIQSKLSNYLTHNLTNNKKTKFIEEIFTNSYYNNTDEDLNHLAKSKKKDFATNNNLNTSIKSLTNYSINSKNDFSQEKIDDKQTSKYEEKENLNYEKDENNVLSSIKDYDKNTNSIKKENNVKYNKFSDEALTTDDLKTSSLQLNIFNKGDLSFSSNNNKAMNHKILQSSNIIQVNPLDTDINIIENNRDKDREKDKLIINEIFNEEIEESIKPSNAFSADNYFTKLSDRTYDKNFDKKSYLDKIAFKNLGSKNLNNNTIKLKENTKDLQQTNTFLKNLNNLKNKIPLANSNFKSNLEKSANNKTYKQFYKENNTHNNLINKKIPYIQVKKYMNKYLNEKGSKKPYLPYKKDSDSLLNLNFQTGKIMNTDPNENIEKTKMNLMKNFNIDVELNKNIDTKNSVQKNSLKQINCYDREEMNSLPLQNQFNETDKKKTIFSDNNPYEYEENYEIENLTSERILISKNTLAEHNNLDYKEANLNNHLDRGIFIKEIKKNTNSPNYNPEKIIDKDCFSPKINSKNSDEYNNLNHNFALYSNTIEFINTNFKPFEIFEILEKIRSDSIFYLGEMNTKFQIFYSKIDLIKKFIDLALQKKELNININNCTNQSLRENQKSDSYRSYNNGSSNNSNNVYTDNYNYHLEKIIDDENGNYIIKIGDHIDYRYEIISELGQGSFGQALKCFDHKNKEFVCVKIIKNKKKFIKQSKIEISLLNFIHKNDKNDDKNIVRILNSFPFRNHNCLVFELLDLNLYDLLKSQDFKGLDNVFIRKIAFQMLVSLNFLKKCSIIHCDLKPENVLLKSSDSYDVKVIDFGSSCFIKERMYSYIQSRFYRAPEIILGINYGLEIDMWSFGCILAELYSGIPIFPGEDETDQLFYMMEYLGIPSFNLLKISKKKRMFFNDDFTPKKIQNSRGKIRIQNTKKIYKFLHNSDPNLIDLVEKCLVWEPEKRIKPEEALLHPYILERYQKEVIEIFNFKDNPDYINLNNKSNSNNKFNSYSCSNSHENSKNINFKYINQIDEPLKILEDKININININSINNCQICNNGIKHKNLNYHNDLIDESSKNIITDIKHKEKSNEKKDKLVMNNVLLTTAQKDKKKAFLAAYAKNMNSNMNYYQYSNNIINFPEKNLENDNNNINTNNYKKNLINSNNEAQSQKIELKNNSKTTSKINNYLSHHN